MCKATSQKGRVKKLQATLTLEMRGIYKIKGKMNGT